MDNCKYETVNCNFDMNNCKYETVNCNFDMNNCKYETINCNFDMSNCKYETVNCNPAGASLTSSIFNSLQAKRQAERQLLPIVLNFY
jgi:hypothetical protein